MRICCDRLRTALNFVCGRCVGYSILCVFLSVKCSILLRIVDVPSSKSTLLVMLVVLVVLWKTVTIAHAHLLSLSIFTTHNLWHPKQTKPSLPLWTYCEWFPASNRFVLSNRQATWCAFSCWVDLRTFKTHKTAMPRISFWLVSKVS